ncbi:MAG: antitoxin family protein [Methanosarcinales archaeon]|nr:antitoxin family protein [Methanosarcinales archaeon]
MRIRAVYRDEVLKPLTKLGLREGEEVEISIIPESLAMDFRGALKIDDQKLIEEIAESDEFG